MCRDYLYHILVRECESRPENSLQLLHVLYGCSKAVHVYSTYEPGHDMVCTARVAGLSARVLLDTGMRQLRELRLRAEQQIAHGT